MTDRYARQTALPEVGPTGQARLAAARVLVVGAGGLGCPVLHYLAAAGVGRLIVVDPDRVEESNLHRQPLYAMADIGARKVEAARAALLRLNPTIAVEARPQRLTPGNAAALVAAADIVVDAADSLAATYVLSDACMQQHTPLISASAVGLAGYAGGYCAGAPSYRAVFPEMPARAASCSSAGVLGSLQAQFVLQWVLGIEPSPLGRLTSFDASRLAFGGFTFSDAAEPEGTPLRFIDAGSITPDDLVVNLLPQRLARMACRPAPAVARFHRAGAGGAGGRPAVKRSATVSTPSGSVLSVAGSDSCGGAGIQADLKTFAAFGVDGATVVTAVTAQNTAGIRAVQVMSAAMVQAQLDAVFDEMDIRAVKLGMLANADIVAAVAGQLERRRPPFVIIDPVLIATSGTRLLDEGALHLLRSRLLPLADCLAPNLAEAAALLGTTCAQGEPDMEAQGRALLALGPRSVVMKGGHAALTEAVDLLVTARGTQRFPAAWVSTSHAHGTGCMLSAGIAAGVARGDPLADAVCRAKAHVRAVLVSRQHRLSSSQPAGSAARGGSDQSIGD